MDTLEDRLAPSAAIGPLAATAPGHAAMTPQLQYVDPLTGGYTPLGITTAYGVSTLLAAGDEGAGQTIAVVDAYDDPDFVSTGSPGYATSDLAAFDQMFSLPDPPSFTKVGEVNPTTFSTTSFPATDPAGPGNSNWEGEEALDVEWAHAIAPMANIVLVETTDDTTLFDGVAWAETHGATVISMSWGTAGGDPTETTTDSYFNPVTYPGITFLASADDQGSGINGNPNTVSPIVTTGQAAYPSDSPDVVSVGGTNLNLSAATGAYIKEGVWNDGPDPGNYYDATGGGISGFESEPAYQYGLTIHNGAATVSAGGMRAAPDVSFLADPQTGVDVYDSYNGGAPFGNINNVAVIGGTSLSSPCWAGLVAIADQIRVSAGEPTLTGATETLPTLYDIYNSPAYSQNFHDITAGASPNNNGTWTAGTGYDLVSGIGTPIANKLVPALADVSQMVYMSPTIGTNNYLLKESGGNLDLLDNGVQVAADPASEITSVDIGGQTDNALTIDYTGITTDITVDFDGGSGTGSGLAHTVTLENGTFTNETYSFAGTGAGTITLDGQTVTFTDVTSSSTTTSVPNVTINLPTGAQATLQAGTPKDEITGTGIVTSGFENPTTSLKVNTAGGSSVVQLAAMDAGFHPTTETFSGVAGDIFRFTNSGAISGQTSLAVNTVVLDLNGCSPTVNALTGAGTITNSAGAGATLSIGAGNGGGTYSGTIQNGVGGVALTKEGTGDEILTGANTYLGVTGISAGTLTDGVNNALPTATTLFDTGSFDLGGFTQKVASITGSGIVTDSGAPATFIVANTSADTFSGTIGGGVNLDVAGSAVLTLSGSNNYTGSTTVNLGATLQGGIVNALPIATMLMVAGTLDLHGFNQMVAGVTGTGSVTDGALGATFTVSNAAIDSFNGTFTQSVSLVAAGAAILTLNGVSSNTGATTINSGATIDDGIANAVSTATTLEGAGVLDLKGFNQQVAGATGSGTVTNSSATAATFTIDNSATDAFPGDLTANLSLTKAGSGVLNLSGTGNTYTGNTTISAGSVFDGVANALPTTTLLSDAGVLNLNGNNQQVGGVTGVGTVTDSGAFASFTVDNSAPEAFFGTLAGNLNLVAAGAALTLGNLSSYTGSTTIQTGAAIDDGIANALPAGTALGDAGTLDLNGFNQQLAAATGSGTITNSSATAATLTIANGTSDAFAGNLTGNLSLVKNGIGALTLSGTGDVYSGATTISTGTLAGGVVDALPVGTALSVAGAFDLHGFNQQAASITGAGSVTNSSGTAAAFTLVNGSADAFNGALSGNLGLIKNGGGTLTLDNADSYTGATVISAGTVVQGVANALPGGTALTDDGTLDLNGANLQVSSVTGTGTVTNSSATAATFTVNNSAADLFGGVLTANLGLTKTGAGTLTLSGPSTYAGATAVSAGALLVNGSIASNVTVTGGGTLGGTGTTGTVTVQNSGNLYSDTSVNTLTTGAVNLQAGAAFGVSIAGESHYSTDTVASGAVSLATTGAGVTLNIAAVGGFVPSVGTFVIVNNSAASAEPINGEFVAGAGIDNLPAGTPLSEGTLLSTNFLGSGLFALMTYQAGPKNDSAAIVTVLSQPMAYVGTLSSNNFLLIQSGASLQLYDNGVLVASQLLIAISTVNISVAPGADATLTIDYSGGQFTTPVTFDGGTGSAAHALTLQNGTSGTQTIAYTGPESGSIALDKQLISFTDVTGVTDAVPENNLLFTLPAAAAASLQDDGSAGNGISALATSNAAFPPATFIDPSTALSVTAGGGSVVQLDGMDSDFNPGAETFSGQADDVFQYQNPAAVPDTANVTVTKATLDLNGFSPSLAVLNGNGVVTDRSATPSTLTVGAQGGSGTFTGVIQNGASAVSLTKLGGGTETLSGANSYNGLTTVSAGTLALGAANAIPAASDVSDNATLDLHGFSDDIGALTGNGLVTNTINGTPTLTIGFDGDSGTFAGVVKNGVAFSLAVAKAGTGTETFTGTSNTYSGGTNVNAGVLQLGDGTTDGSAGSASVTIGLDGTLQFDSAADSTAAAFAFTNALTGAGVISVISQNNGNLGAVEVSGNNTGFTGTLNITGGSYQLGGDNSLGVPANINVSGTGQFYFGAAAALTVNSAVALSTLGYPDTAGTLGAVRFSGAADVLAGPVTITGTALVSAYQSSGTIAGSISGGTLEVGAGLAAETIILTGTNSYGATTINASATLQIGNGAAAGTLGAGAVSDGGQLAFDRGDTFTVNDNIGGAGTLAQIGTGTLILPASNAYSYLGATNVSSGVLQVDGVLSSGVSVSGTGKLTGSGSVASVIGSGGALQPGDGGAPALLFTGAVNLQTGAALTPLFAGSASYSQASVASGTISLGGAALNLPTTGSFTPALGDVYTLIDNSAASAQPVTGLLVAGAGVTNFPAGMPLPEGADLTDNFLDTGDSAVLTYQAGANEDSVAILVRGALNYTGTQANNDFLLSEAAGNILDLYDNGVVVASQAAALTTSVNVRVASGATGSLTIDYSGGQFKTSVTFAGGANGSLTLQNGAFTKETVSFTGPQAGTVNLDGQAITFAQVASFADAVAAVNLTFNLPAAAQGSLQDDGAADNGVSALVSSNGKFPGATFADPSGTFTLNADGSSQIQLAALDAGFDAASVIFAGQASDTFTLTTAGAIPSTVAVGVDVATLNLNGLSPTIGGLTGTGTITNAAKATPATLTINVPAGSASFAGAIKNGAGVVALTKLGDGVQALAGADSYTGATTIGAGVLQLGAANAFSAGSDVADDGTLDLNRFSASIGALTGAGIVTNAATGVSILTVGADGHSGTFSGALQDGAGGTVGVTKTGAGTLTLAGLNTYSGPTTISAGTLQLGAANAFSPNSNVADGATLDLDGFSGAIGALTGKGAVANSTTTPATLTVGADGASGAFAGAIRNGKGTGTVALTKIGAGTQTLAAVNTYTGGTTISGGTLQIGVANTLPAGDVMDNGILDLHGFKASVGALTGSGVVTNGSTLAAVLTVGADGHSGTFAGSIENGAGTVGLTKIGAGIETFAGAGNSYSGPTIISAGTLQAGFTDCFSINSDVTDNATLDLAGFGVITGALAGSGAVTTSAPGLAVLTVGGSGHNAIFAGALKNGAGTLGLGKTGAGDETLTGHANSFTGAVDLTAGALTVQDTLFAGTFGQIVLDGPNVALNGAGVIRGQVIVSGSYTHIDGVTVTAGPNGPGIVVDAGADFTEIGLTKGITVNGGSSTTTGIVVLGSAVIFNSKISGHNVDVNVDGGSAVLQGDTLNAGAGADAAGLEVDNFGIVDAGQFSSDATPLPGGPTGNVGFYGDITGLFSGTPLGSSAHSTGGNTFDGYTADAVSDPDPTVPQAIRDLNTGAAPFATLPNQVETSFTYGGGALLGRMDVTAHNDTFNGVRNPSSAVAQQLVVDEHRQSDMGFVLFALPSLTISQTPVPTFVPAGKSFGIIVTYANNGTTPTFGVLKEYLSADETFDANLNPGWVYQGNGLVTFDLGLLAPGASGSITFVGTVVARPPSAVLSLTTAISFDIASGVNLDAITETSKTTPSGVGGRLS